MMVLVGVAVLTFASLVFFVERDSEFQDGKWTFLDSVWWGILTVTTVGHHIKYQTSSSSQTDSFSPQIPSDLHRKTAGRVLCSRWNLHPHPAHPHCGQFLCELLQEQTLEERGGCQEGHEEEGAESNAQSCPGSQHLLTSFLFSGADQTGGGGEGGEPAGHDGG